MSVEWWMWMLAGFALLALELTTPGGFYIFFFGVGAVSVGLLSAMGVAGPPWMEWLLFGMISVISLALFRKPLQKKTQVLMGREVDPIVGELAVALSEITTQQLGKAELRGTAWTARNVGETTIPSGQRCKVERVEGLTLEIRA